MSDLQKNILVGNLLGDASLQTYTNGKTWRARFIQGDINKDYLFHLYHSVYYNLVSTPPNSIMDKLGHIRWYFNTTVQNDLSVLAHLFYQKRGNRWIKVLHPDLINFITPASLAYWYMDDGSLKKVGSKFRTSILCTDSFSLEDIKLLRNIFQTNFGIHISIYTNRPNQYRIYIPKSYYNLFKEIITPWMHESMQYKIE